MADRTIEIDLAGVIERRDDHYAAYIRGLGFTGLGKSIEDARVRAIEIAETVLNDLEKREGEDAVFALLTRAGIGWRVMSEGSWQSSIIRHADHRADHRPAVSV